MSEHGGARPGAGRPRIEIDLKVVEGVARIFATDEEIAFAIKIHPSTFYNRLKDTPELVEAIARGRSEGRMHLRREQMKLALAGNTTMLIWLGKQELAQRDQFVNQVVGHDGGAIKHELALTYTDVERLDAIRRICDTIRDRVGEPHLELTQDVGTSEGSTDDSLRH